MDSLKIKKRMVELGQPIEEQIMMCDSREEVIMLACVMLTHVKTMLTAQVGEKGMKEILEFTVNE